ncbi:MAG: hypothetical protein J0I96_04550 [Rhodanobacter sp.]|nr:hypothetical protein [Rhodanobacter sp.]
MLTTDTTSDTFTRTVKVRFATESGGFREGDFKASFRRITKERLDEFLDDEAGYTQSEVLDEVLTGVSGIGQKGEDGKIEELPPADQLKWVRNSIECCNAAFRDFFEAMRQDNGAEKTSKKRR